MSTPGTSSAAGSQAAAAGASSAAGCQVQAADDVRELLLSTTADASDPSTPLSAPDLRLLIDRLRLRSDRLHASALSFAASNRGALANALLRAASAAESSASFKSSLDSALAPLASSPDLSDLRALADRLLAARRELAERQEHLAAASTIASLAARLREARAAASPLDRATAVAELKTFLIDPDRSGSGQDDPVVFGLLRSDWEQLVDELQVGLGKNVEECVEFAPEGGKVVVRATPRGHSGGSHGVELPVALQALEAAARVIRIGSRTDFVLGDILHPAINWADKESHVDPDEMAKIKSAFVGNLPEDVNEEYLRKLFEQFGEVVRVAISRRGQGPVGFVHFTNRSELENAIEEMDGKTVRGPNRGPSFRIQVSVARPVADNDKKRSREEVRTRRSNVSGDRQDYSHGRYGHDSLDRQMKAPRLSNYVADASDPYESAVNSLPSAVKEVLLRILRLGIGTRYDIDIHCVKSLNELPESSALAVLNQFLISGGDKRNKGDYFASLIAKHQAEAFGLTHTLHGTTYLPRNPEIHSKRYPDEDYDFVTPGSSRYNSSGHHPSTYYVDDPPMSQSRIRRYAEERSTIVRNPEPRLRHDEIDIRMNPEPRLAFESRHNTGKDLDRRYIQEHSSNIERSAEEAVLSRERRFLPAAGYNTDLGSDFRSRSPAEYSAERQQVRFDPFTGEPYKFDPFTGEPIRPDPNQRRSGSLY